MDYEDDRFVLCHSGVLEELIAEWKKATKGMALAEGELLEGLRTLRNQISEECIEALCEYVMAIKPRIRKETLESGAGLSHSHIVFRMTETIISIRALEVAKKDGSTWLALVLHLRNERLRLFVTAKSHYNVDEGGTGLCNDPRYMSQEAADTLHTLYLMIRYGRPCA